MKDYRKVAQEFGRLLKEKYGDRIERIILFGSVARGEYHEDSDVDLIVVTPGNWFELQREIAGDAIDWLLRTGVYVSVKVFSSDDFARIRETGFGRGLSKEGVPLA